MRLIPLLAAALLGGCASTAAVTRGGGDALAAIRALPETARPRIVVLPVLDHTPPYSARSLDINLVLLNLHRPEAEALKPAQFTRAVRDMLVTELFGSQGFIVLDREDLPVLLAEQAFQDGERISPQTAVPKGALEGAQYLVAAAITAFDTGSEGGAIPIPIPLGFSRDVAALGVLSLGYKKGSVAMDIRVLDATTGRVLHTAAVEGSNSKLGLDFGAIAASRAFGVTQVPELIKIFKNTPVEQALQKMSIAAVEQIAAAFAALAKPATAPPTLAR